MVVVLSGIFINLLITLFTFLIILTIYFKWAFNYWKRKGVQSPPPNIPFGNMTETALQRLSAGEAFKNIYEEYGKKGLRYAGVYLLSKPTFLVFDLDLIKNILTKDFQYFTDHGSYLNEKIEPLSAHLFNLKGHKWKNSRAKLSPTFTSGKVKMMFQTLMSCSDELINVMDKISEEGKVVNIKDIMGRFTTDIIGSCAFGIECNSLKDPESEFRNYGRKVFEVKGFQAIKNVLSFCFPQVLHFFNLTLQRKEVTKFFMDVVKATVNYREANNIARKDFMHLLIQLKNNVKIQEDDNDNLKDNCDSGEVGQGLTISEMAAQAFVFFIAGFETSATTLTFCFYELVANPSLQEKLREEVQEILDKHNGQLSYEAIMEMTYMDKCISETLRKYPPVPFLSRECNMPYKVPESDLTLDNGTMVFIPVLGIQHNPEYYPNPDKFDPERFSSENKAKRHHFTWLPFGEGPRICIGLRFGIMQMKVALAVLLKNYRFTLNSKTESPLRIDPNTVVMTFDGTVWLDIEKLTS